MMPQLMAITALSVMATTAPLVDPFNRHMYQHESSPEPAAGHIGYE